MLHYFARHFIKFNTALNVYREDSVRSLALLSVALRTLSLSPECVLKRREWWGADSRRGHEGAANIRKIVPLRFRLAHNVLDVSIACRRSNDNRSSTWLPRGYRCTGSSGDDTANNAEVLFRGGGRLESLRACTEKTFKIISLLHRHSCAFYASMSENLRSPSRATQTSGKRGEFRFFAFH